MMKNTIAIDHVYVCLRNVIVERKEFTTVGFVLQTGELKRAEGNIQPHDKIQIEYFTQQSRSVAQPTAVIDREAWLLSQLLKRLFQRSGPSKREIILVLAGDH